MIRRYVEALTAIRVRKTGGVYFVHRQHADTLAALRWQSRAAAAMSRASLSASP